MRKHFALRTALFVCAMASAAQAKAEMLSLDCTNQTSQQVWANVWVDFDKSSLTWQFNEAVGNAFPPDERSFPVQITATSINWSFS